MPSIFDIAPLGGSVVLRGKTFEVQGIAVEDIVRLMQRFPLMRSIVGQKMGDLSIEGVLSAMPEVAHAVIAMGLGDSTPEAEAHVAKSLSMGEKLECLEKIVEVTLPSGIVPFVETLTRLASGGGGTGWARATSSVEPSNTA